MALFSTTFPRQSYLPLWPNADLTKLAIKVLTTSSRLIVGAFDFGVSLLTLINILIFIPDILSTIVLLELQPFGGVWYEQSKYPAMGEALLGHGGVYLVAALWFGFMILGELGSGWIPRYLLQRTNPTKSLYWQTAWKTGTTLVRLQARVFFLYLLDPLGLPKALQIIIPQTMIATKALLSVIGFS